MADATQNFTDMFKKLGEQFKVPQFDMAKIMDQQQKNLDALTRSWQSAAACASAVATKQREILEAAVKQMTEMAKEYTPTGNPQEILAKQSEFAKKAMEAAIANTKDLAELVQKSSTEAMQIIQQRMKDSFEEIRGGLDKK
jgi:phasin family protein